MFDTARQYQQWGFPSHGRGRRFDPCIAHHSKALKMLRNGISRFEFYSAQSGEHRQNMEPPHGQNPGAMFFACSPTPRLWRPL